MFGGYGFAFVGTNLYYAVEYSYSVHVHCSGRIIFRHANLSLYFEQIYCLDYQRGRMVKVTSSWSAGWYRGTGSYHGADKLDSGFQVGKISNNFGWG